jgi:hypothetical protein
VPVERQPVLRPGAPLTLPRQPVPIVLSAAQFPRVTPPTPVNPYLGEYTELPNPSVAERAMVPYTGRKMPEPAMLSRNAVIINTNCNEGNYVVLTRSGQLEPMPDAGFSSGEDCNDSDAMVDGASGGVNSRMMEMLSAGRAGAGGGAGPRDAEAEAEGMDTC